MDEVFFIDKDGNKLSSEDICSHIGLGNLILQKNENLREEFQRSKKRSLTEFLIVDKGYVAAGSMGEYRNITFDRNSISEKQKRLIHYYHAEGYRCNDLSMDMNREKEK